MFLKFLSVFLLFCLLKVQAGTFRAKSNNLIQGRIIGGQNAARGQFPYHVLLADRLSFHYFCGGSIITRRHILSAAHCIQKFKRNTNELLAILNTSNLRDSDFTSIDISKAYAHRKYTNDSIQFDISILLTRREIQFNKFIQPIQLPTVDIQTSGAAAVVAGWGALWEPKTPQDRTPRPNNLQFQRTTILSGSDCWTTFKDMIGSDNHSDWPALKKDIDQTIICTTNIVGTGMCGGDSGSGIVVNNTLVGIVSSTLDCAKGYPDMGTNVFSYLKWIEIHMDRLSKETYYYYYYYPTEDESYYNDEEPF